MWDWRPLDITLVERLLAELGIEVWIGDAAEIKRQRGRKQKTDREDGRLLLRLLWRIASLESGHRIRRIGICGNCFGTGIGWCRCGRAS